MAAVLLPQGRGNAGVVARVAELLLGGIEVGKGIREVRAVDVRDEMNARAAAIGAKRLVGQLWPEIRTADPEMDHIGERRAIRCGESARADAGSEREHSCAFARNQIGNIGKRRVPACGPQGNMPRRACFRRVDGGTFDHGIARRLDATCRSQLEQCLERFWLKPLLRDIDEKIAGRA